MCCLLVFWGGFGLFISKLELSRGREPLEVEEETLLVQVSTSHTFELLGLPTELCSFFFFGLEITVVLVLIYLTGGSGGGGGLFRRRQRTCRPARSTARGPKQAGLSRPHED